MSYAHGRRWTEEIALLDLHSISSSLGRMPSANELLASGNGGLANYICRHGGYRLWARKIVLPLKDTETIRGQYAEDATQLFLIERGFRVEKMTTLAPFDLLVNKYIRVDVKSAKYAEYGEGGYAKGFVFGINKKYPVCDMYILCGVNEGSEVIWRYFIPAHHACVTTLTITPYGKYSVYRNNIEALERLSSVMESLYANI